ncbi:phosphoribosylanthranilate isomerase [Paenibacillus sp. FSL K6-1230]|uniref:phosphoribosylanthranilate isomerase n=1 Tax=Paenibacillus sp. FSL K6-1230 TaxID=2921603 RepID=UPI0003A327EF
MERTAVKICGLQSVEVLKSMVHLPVDYIGFVFAPSKRRVTAQQAAELIPILREWQTEAAPQSVGVFVNPELQELRELLHTAPLDIIQLHGQESPEFCRAVKEQLDLRVIKALPITDGTEASVHNQLDDYIGTIDALLLDTHDPVYGGGSGRTFAWDRIPAYQDWAQQHGITLLVAGGLHSENVTELIALYAPDGLDVSSGVETDGMKDIQKITSFVERVKRLDTIS